MQYKKHLNNQDRQKYLKKICLLFGNLGNIITDKHLTNKIKMVKPIDLRIGNLLYFPFIKENVEVLGINAHENSNGIYNTISYKNDNNLYCEN